MPHEHRGEQALTWKEIGKLSDRETIYIEVHGHPYGCVLRWEPWTVIGESSSRTLCVCTLDPATMDDTHVLARFDERRFEEKRPKIWPRLPTAVEIGGPVQRVRLLEDL